MLTSKPAVEPELKPSERDELAHLDFFEAKIQDLCERGLISPASLAQIAAETDARRDVLDRRGQCRSAMNQARKLADANKLTEARDLAEQARHLEPDRRDAWELQISLEWSLEHDAEAIACCTEAAQRFPELAARLDRLRSERAPREDKRQQRAREEAESQRIAQQIETARRASEERDDPQAIALVDAVIGLRPDHVDALAIAAFCAQRQENLEQALEHYAHLQRLEPGNLTWGMWRQNVQSRLESRKQVAVDRELAEPDGELGPASRSVAEIHVPPPPLSWSSIAGEFLQDHWQKLILCLAVLLIVVSSTVGAQLLLGERLWSPVGKCSLAMVGTLMFAALGMGLVRWGAQRAGQMMLVTTLIVVPIHFILAGELGLVLEPSPFRLAGFAIQIGALLALSRVVSGQLVSARDSWMLTVPLIVMSVFNATMARGVVGPWGWQFAAFQTPALVFLAAVWGLKTRHPDPAAETNRQFGILFLGVLGFALVTSVIRTGTYALELLPTLYGVPLIVTALALVHGARWFAAYDPDPRQVALMRLGGYALAGLAFAAALARPLAPSPLLNGNTLAVALIGLLLFVDSLKVERLPAYLYMSFGAFFLAYFEIRQALGYGSVLTGPYRSIHGLFFNSVLAALAIQFARRWNDGRLFRHCHYIGVPLSVAACAYSGFDPRAALYCMSGYAVLYLVASWLFSAPLVQYLAIAAMAGAAYFGSTLWPSITPEQQAAWAAGMGLGCSVVFLLQGKLGASSSFRLPWAHGGLALCSIAILGATVAMGLAGTPSFWGALTFLMVSLASAALNLERRESALGYLALLAGNVAGALAIVTFDIAGHWGRALGLDRYAILAGLAGLVEISLGAWLGRAQRDSVPPPIGASYVWPLRHFGLVLASLTAGLCAEVLLAPTAGLSAVRLINVSFALGTGAAAFAIGSAAVYRHEWLAHVTVWTAAAAYSCGVLGLLKLAQAPNLAPAMLIALAAASLLAFAVWDRLRFSHYRKPLLYAALALIAVVEPIALLIWQPAGHLSLALAFCGLALVLIAGEMLAAALAHFAMIALLGVWLHAFDTVLPLRTVSSFGLAFTSFGVLLMAVAEVLRKNVQELQEEIEVAHRRSALARLFVAQIPPFVVVLSFLADALAWHGLGAYWWTGLVYLMAALGLLWSSRLVREPLLVYLGLWHAVAAGLDLSRWLIPWQGTGLLCGWLAVSLALTALGLWAAGVVGRKCRLDAIYWAPCLNTALGLTIGVAGLAIAGRLLARNAFLLCSVALFLDCVIYVLLSRSRQWAGLLYPAVASFTTASYVILLSVGTPDPANAYILGLNAVAQGLILWVLGDLSRRFADAWLRGCTRPLFHSALALTVLTIPFAYRSPVTMSLVALSFLLTVKSLPSTRWIYPTAAAIGAAVYFPWLSQLSRIEFLAASLVGAYLLWLIGLTVRRHKTALSTRLGLAPLSYEVPLFNLAALSAVLTFLMKFDVGVVHTESLTAHPWIALLLAPLTLAMARVHPLRPCVHGSLAFLSWGIISVVAPSLMAPGFLMLALVILATGLQGIDLAIRPIEQDLSYRLDIRAADARGVARIWWQVLGVLGAGIALFVLVSGMAQALGLPHDPPLAVGVVDWWAMLAAIALVATQVLLLGHDPELISVLHPEGLLVALELCAMAFLWWLGVAESPLAHRGILPTDFYPLVTAVAVLAIADVNDRLSRRRIWDEPGRPSSLRNPLLVRLSSPLLLVLSLLAATFTFGQESLTTLTTLALVALALHLWAVRTEALWAAYLGSLYWSSAGLAGGLVLARRLSSGLLEPRLVFAALGELAAVSLLGLLSGLLRRFAREPGSETKDPAPSARPLALAIEQVAFLGSLVVAGLVAVAVSQYPPAGWLAGAEIAALLGVALFHLLLTRRWQAEWMVYFAQASLVGAYVIYRLAHPLPTVADAAVLTLFAFVDLGIAEVMERVQLGLYSGPTRYASLVLPVLPLVQLIGKGGLTEITVFHLVVAGTFYAVACGALQWRSLGYAAGVLYNAALWVLWGQMGWQLADHPQFFLVPVGLSAILFAEVNRHDLGRELVNSIRSAGLITTYLAMAAPVWQFRSFGDWVALLLGSLLGLFAGIGLRVQTFVWLGLVTFLADVAYELGRVGLEHALAKWAIMLSLGILLIFFVALNEKKQIVITMRGYYQEIRSWE
jgi:tetratricopeptide (TPR) repeat protein